MDTISIIFISCLSTVVLILSLFSVYSIYHLKKKIEDRESDNTVRLGYQREQLENRVYNVSKQFVSDSGFFLDTSHILIDASKADMIIKHNVPDYSYFSDLGINLSSIEINDSLIVCLMPFNSRFNNIYDNIKIVSRSQNYICKRSDEEYIANNTNLRKYIVELILKAKIVVAVLDGRNPNVFYEIGIAHSMGKLVLLLANVNSTSEIPVDFRANRLILYNDMKDLREKLSKTIKAVRYD